jgi:hypothetical protein
MLYTAFGVPPLKFQAARCYALYENLKSFGKLINNLLETKSFLGHKHKKKVFYEDNIWNVLIWMRELGKVMSIPPHLSKMILTNVMHMYICLKLNSMYSYVIILKIALANIHFTHGKFANNQAQI